MNCVPKVTAPNWIDFSNDKTVIAITNGGGGGHKMVVQAMQEDFKQRELLGGRFRILDVIQDSFPSKCGKLIYNRINNTWNQAKKKGNLKKQEFLVNGKPFKKGPSSQLCADILFFPPVFFATLFRLLRDKNITRIIDAQPLSTGALIKAARLVNSLFNRKIRVTKIMTDLPTADATHFASSIKKLSNKDKKIFELITVTPLIQNNMSEEEWWREFFGLELNKTNPEKSEVKYCQYPLRKPFYEWKDKDVKDNHPTMQLLINNDDEYKMINRLMGNKLKKERILIENSNSKNIVNIDIKDEDFIQFATIGSQASYKTKEYLKDFVDVCKKKIEEDDPTIHYYFFVGCGKHEIGKQDLFMEVADLAETVPKELKDRVHIVPLGSQEGEEVAAMIHRADVGVYGAGGLTTMEVLTTAKGLVLFHSEISPLSTSFFKSQKELNHYLLQGFAVWEKGNVRYAMNRNSNAKIVIPGQVYKNIVLQPKLPV